MTKIEALTALAQQHIETAEELARISCSGSAGLHRAEAMRLADIIAALPPDDAPNHDESNKTTETNEDQ